MKTGVTISEILTSFSRLLESATMFSFIMEGTECNSNEGAADCNMGSSSGEIEGSELSLALPPVHLAKRNGDTSSTPVPLSLGVLDTVRFEPWLDFETIIEKVMKKVNQIYIAIKEGIRSIRSCI